MNRNDYLKKLYAQTGYIKRTELAARFMEALEHPLLLIVAGPGYGKTTLAAMSLSKLKSPLLWVSLTPLDNEPAFFWKSFCCAAAKELPAMASLMRGRSFPDTLMAISSFILSLSEADKAGVSGHRIILVFDNLEVITNPRVLDFISHLLSVNQMTEAFRLHLVLISKQQIPWLPSADVPLPFTALSGYQTITNHDLAFSKREVAELCRIHQKGADTAAVDRLMEESEGWPYLIYSTVTESPENLSLIYGKVYNLFHRLYYAAFDEATRELLVSLSIFSSFHPEILLRLQPGEDTSAQLIRTLQDIPFVSYSFSDGTYRMRRPYRTYLRTLFPTLGEAARIRTLHVAGDYLFVHADMEDILHYYMDSRNYDAIRRCMLILARHTLSTSYVKQILAVLLALPESYRDKHLWVPFFIALCYLKSDQPARAKTAFSSLLDVLHPEKAAHRSYIGECILALALLSLVENESFDLSLLKQAAECLPDGSTITAAANAVGENSCFFLPEGGRRDVGGMISYMKTFVRYFTAAAGGALSGLDYLFAAEATLYGGDFAQAEYCAAQAVFKASMEGQHDIVLNAYHIGVRLSFATGSYEGVIKYRKALSHYYKLHHPKGLSDLMDIFEGFDQYHLGDAEGMAGWIREGDVNRYKEKRWTRGRNLLVSAAYALMHKNYANYHALLDELQKVLTDHGLWILQVNLCLHYCISYFHQGYFDRMCASFAKACRMIYADDLFFTVAEFGRPILPVLKAVAGAGAGDIDEIWLHRLIAHTQEYVANADKVAHSFKKNTLSKSVSALILTRRERQVLLLLSQGLSRAEIAQNLSISVSGVQKFLSNIYLKLGAKNGTDAVSIAHGQKLI